MSDFQKLCKVLTEIGVRYTLGGGEYDNEEVEIVQLPVDIELHKDDRNLELAGQYHLVFNKDGSLREQNFLPLQVRILTVKASWTEEDYEDYLVSR